MNLSLINLILIIGLGVLLGWENNKRHRNLYIFIMTLVFLLEACLRHSRVGMDTTGYIMFFENIQDMPWSEVFSGYVGGYVHNNVEVEVGYAVFVKLLTYITRDWNLFEFFRDTVFFIPFGIYMKKYANNFYHLTFAMIFYVSLLHSVPMNGGRQLLSLGFGILSFLQLQENKYWTSAILILVGALFHQSCLLCFVIMGCSLLNSKNLKITHVVALLFIPLVLLSANRIIVLMGEAVGNERYISYGMGLAHGQANTFILLLELLSIFCLFAIKQKQLDDDRSLRVFYSTIIGTTLFGPLITVNGAMIRVAMYFYLYMTLLVPYAIDSVFIANSRRLIYVIVVATLGLLYVSGSGAYYYFFWQ